MTDFRVPESATPAEFRAGLRRGLELYASSAAVEGPRRESPRREVATVLRELVNAKPWLMADIDEDVWHRMLRDTSPTMGGGTALEMTLRQVRRRMRDAIVNVGPMTGLPSGTRLTALERLVISGLARDRIDWIEVEADAGHLTVRLRERHPETTARLWLSLELWITLER